jgi:hypothetical protein
MEFLQDEFLLIQTGATLAWRASSTAGWGLRRRFSSFAFLIYSNQTQLQQRLSATSFVITGVKAIDRV